MFWFGRGAYTPPTTEWNLRQWIEAADPKINVAKFARIINDQHNLGWSPQNIHNWIRQGIPDRKIAFIILETLRNLAQQNHRPLLNNTYLIAHSTLFFQSSVVCPNGPYASLFTDELEKLTADSMTDGERKHLRESKLRVIKEWVQPPPPKTLFGRKNDLLRLENTLDERDQYLVVIDAPGGEGKTTLAWEMVRQSMQNGRFYNAVWFTDKRRILTATGTDAPVHMQHEEQLAFERILRLMVFHFEWSDLFDLEGAALEAACADKLRSGRYLVVVDNLETVENAERIVQRLNDILTPIYPHRYNDSRVIITSRVWPNRNQAHMNGVARMDIQGIEEDARIPYLRYLLNNDASVDMSVLEAIASKTYGNPLLMQIALRHYTLTRSDITEVLNYVLHADGSVFDYLFGDITKQLSDDVLQLAIHAAVESATQEYSVIEPAPLWIMWQKIHGVQALTSDHNGSSVALHQSFLQALATLTHNYIINMVNDVYLMHPLVREYLVQLYEPNREPLP